MGTLELMGIAVGLSMDAFAVAIGTSAIIRGVTLRQVFRLAFHFGLFQALMPVIGWLLGTMAAGRIQAYDHWVAFGLLCFVGGRAVWEALFGESDRDGPRRDPTRGMSLVLLSLATSVDALAVGLTFAMLDIRVWYPALVIGLVAGSFTVAGMVFGARLGAMFGRVMEVLGGLVLIGIGLRILIGHLIMHAS